MQGLETAQQAAHRSSNAAETLARRAGPDAPASLQQAEARLAGLKLNKSLVLVWALAHARVRTVCRTCSFDHAPPAVVYLAYL